MASAFAMIMGGGASESLSVLTEVRAEPAGALWRQVPAD